MIRRITVLASVILLAGCADQQPAQEQETIDVDRTGATELGTTASFGDPLPGLSPDELTLFQEGRDAFQDVEGVADGLGPVFNEASCVACHAGPGSAVGGSNGRLETRFGKRNADGTFDPLAALGGSLLQDHAIGVQPSHTPPDASVTFNFIPEVVPAEANVVAKRRTTPLFGLGLVDAVPDAEIRVIADLQRLFFPSIAGKVAVVTDLTSGKLAVGKFGWKNGNPTLLQFSADAYLNEMGITSPLFPDENCPQGDCSMMAQFNPRPDLNDADGADVVKFANFMTFLAPPPRGPQDFQTDFGGKVFKAIGCAHCHVPALVTGSNAVAALNKKIFHPFSDFLLHDMGSLGDGIAQGAANTRQIRTAPLWGVRVAPALLHDGRTTSVSEAILAHDGQGRGARNRFARLDRFERAALLAFLNSL
ncbi:MAG TPA: di-heme oxidoredictase family protein [Myxococcales bacterium]|nr:di-heme oxidoredictase family protein [Myxococcales bacterium]